MSDIPQIENIVLKALLSNPEYAREVSPFLVTDYFETMISQSIFNDYNNYMVEYNDIPSRDYMLLRAEKNELFSEDQFLMAKELISEVYDTNVSKYDNRWLLEESEKWAQERSLYNAIVESIGILDGSDKKKRKYGSINEIVSNALSTSFNVSIGHDYMEESDRRYDMYHTDEKKIPMHLKYFNEIWGGGLARKTVTCIGAGTNAGKSAMMCDWAANHVSAGYDVLYITMEMSEAKIAKRIDANILDIPMKQIDRLDKEQYLRKISHMKDNVHGQMVIKEYPTGIPSVQHFRSLLQDLKMKKKFIPDLIYIDYMNICSSASIPSSMGSYFVVKSIAEEFRGLAVESNTAMVTATQFNRSGIGSSDVGMDSTSESMGGPMTFDSYIALIRTEELDSLNQVLLKQLKNRDNDVNHYRKFVVGVDLSKMKYYDVEQTAQVGFDDSGQEETENSFGSGFGRESIPKKSKFDDLD